MTKQRSKEGSCDGRERVRDGGWIDMDAHLARSISMVSTLQSAN